MQSRFIAGLALTALLTTVLSPFPLQAEEEKGWWAKRREARERYKGHEGLVDSPEQVVGKPLHNLHRILGEPTLITPYDVDSTILTYWFGLGKDVPEAKSKAAPLITALNDAPSPIEREKAFRRIFDWNSHFFGQTQTLQHKIIGDGVYIDRRGYMFAVYVESFSLNISTIRLSPTLDVEAQKKHVGGLVSLMYERYIRHLIVGCCSVIFPGHDVDAEFDDSQGDCLEHGRTLHLLDMSDWSPQEKFNYGGLFDPSDSENGLPRLHELIWVQEEPPCSPRQSSDRSRDEVLTNKDIAEMVEAEVDLAIIKDKITSTTANFDLSAEGLIFLSKAGVPKDVIQLRLSTESQKGDTGKLDDGH